MKSKIENRKSKIEASLPGLELQLLNFRLGARESVMLPPFLGSTLRGAFGAALKQVLCIAPHRTCQIEERDESGKTRIAERCWFFEGCPYQYIFESPNLIPDAENHPLLRGHNQLPHPFVIIPPFPKLKNSRKNASVALDFNDDYEGNHFSRGEFLDFSILLVGRATAFWSQVLVAARLLAENGLGAGRVPFVLIQAFAGDSIGQPVEIFNSRENRVTAKCVAPVSLALVANLRAETLARRLAEENRDALEINFLTPARIRIANALKPEITATDFFKKITERIEFLARIHQSPSDAKDYRPAVENLAASLALSGAFKTYKYKQFSNRQGGKTLRDVAATNLRLSGEGIIESLPFLAAGEILHIGANTSDGFGRFATKLP